MPILLAGKRDGVCGHAAVGMASLRITRVGVSWSTLRASRPTRIGDTKLLCPVAHASVVWPGVSIAHIGGDKALLLCQHGSPNPPRAFSSRRLRGYPLYLDRVTPLSTAVRRGTRVRSRTSVRAKRPIRQAREGQSRRPCRAAGGRRTSPLTRRCGDTTRQGVGV